MECFGQNGVLSATACLKRLEGVGALRELPTHTGSQGPQLARACVLGFRLPGRWLQSRTSDGGEALRAHNSRADSGFRVFERLELGLEGHRARSFGLLVCEETIGVRV